MKQITLVVLASLALISVGACVGKGKGKAPPAPIAPIVTKG
jgi:hypothetical protein